VSADSNVGARLFLMTCTAKSLVRGFGVGEPFQHHKEAP